MHGELLRLGLVKRRRDQRGAVAIIVALSMTALLVLAALVIDFGIVRIDRQVDKSAADSATLAGLHSLNTGDGNAHPYVGVCAAIRYLKDNSDRFDSADENSGWTDGTGAAKASGCTDATLRAQTCTAGSAASWARWTWSGTYQGAPLSVAIQSGYQIPTGVWGEDSLPASLADASDGAQGCDQLAVIVSQSREPGLGSLATNSDLKTAIRSVGRVKQVPGGYAPALLLLRTTGCPVLDAGSASGGSFIHVLGALSSNGLSQPGTIHADTDAGGGCSGGSNQNTFLGTGANGIVAYAAPTVGNPTVADATKPGSITSYAASIGKTGGFLYDSLNNVYGSSALTTGGTKSAVTARGLITRKPVDDRYKAGVQAAITAANGVFASASTTYTKFPASVNACKPTQAQVNALSLTASSNLYIDCNGKFVGDNAGLSIPAGRIYFRGWVNPAGPVSLPNANHVYIENTGTNSDAISLGTGATFQMNNAPSNLSGSTCSNSQNTSKSILFVKSGDIKQSGTSTLQMCHTTVIMMGGSTTGCVPASSSGANPAATPCPGINSGLGTGQFTQTGGGIDWTAPDQYDVMTLSNGNADPAKAPAWTNPDGMEDLALWSESGTNSSNTYNMNGGGVFHVRGVYMVPNADPFRISGGAAMNLVNAQFIASAIRLSGTGTNITMSVDPNAAVTLPSLGIVGLVR